MISPRSSGGRSLELNGDNRRLAEVSGAFVGTLSLRQRAFGDCSPALKSCSMQVLLESNQEISHLCPMGDLSPLTASEAEISVGFNVS